MTIFQVGDSVPIRHIVRDEDGTLTSATVAATVVAPDAGTSNPTMTETSTGVYDGAIPVDEAGVWSYYFTVSGAVTDVTPVQQFYVSATTIPTYATLSKLRKYVGLTDLTDTTDDEKFQDALESASAEINDHCDRRFWADTTATARLFHPAAHGGVVLVDDFWTDDDLLIETTTDGVTWTAFALGDVELEPLNGVMHGVPGWPYTRIRAVDGARFFRRARATVRVTAKWGWRAVPAPVHQACLILAAENAKLSEAPFGVGGYGEFGIVKARDNPFAARKLQRYQLDPAKAL
ncbi:MAG TPA: hypothetical protein VJ782_08910 [Aeromicrobium sp.]|nr:hypothetical protein [Aeromicrobium sp.]